MATLFRWAPAPPPKKGHTSNFRPLSVVAKWLDGLRYHLNWYGDRPRPVGPGDFVLDRDPAPLPKKDAQPQFLAHVYCGQTAAWIKMVLGIVVGLGPGHIVLDGDPGPPKKRRPSPPPQFSAMSTVAKRLDVSRCQLPLSLLELLQH